jgi:hypothetical protein
MARGWRFPIDWITNTAVDEQAIPLSVETLFVTREALQGMAIPSSVVTKPVRAQTFEEWRQKTALILEEAQAAHR